MNYYFEFFMTTISILFLIKVTATQMSKESQISEGNDYHWYDFLARAGVIVVPIFSILFIVSVVAMELLSLPVSLIPTIVIMNIVVFKIIQSSNDTIQKGKLTL